MPRTFISALARSLVAVTGLATIAAAQGVPYDIVYVRQPRFGDNTNTLWPEIFHPARIDPGADLVLLHPNGSEEILISGGAGAVTDPFVSFDGQWVYYSYFYDQTDINYQRGLPYAGADIFRINLLTRAIEQLTFAGSADNPGAPLRPGEFTPNTGAAHWYQTPDGAYQPTSVPNPYAYDHLGYGIFNLGPAPVAGGRIAFTSNRNGFAPPKGYTSPTLQLFVMDADGSNVTAIAPMSISSALHPTPLRDGRLMFSSHESQGLRDTRLWGIWSIYPDGRNWGPLASAFRDAQAFHFMTQITSGDIVFDDYYNLNNNGFGALYRRPLNPPAGTPAFYSAFIDDNPPIDQTVGGGFSYPFRMPFTPWGLYSITPFTHGNDEAAPIGAGGTRVGKFTHPSAAPNDDLLVVWTAGPANDLDRPSPLPYYDAGIYLIRNSAAVHGPADLVLIKNDPAYNEAWPRAVLPYSAVHGVAEPDPLPWLPNDGSIHAALPAGTPYGLAGTSSLYKRESFPGWVTPWSDTFDGLDAFNTAENGQSSNWFTQGSDAGKYSNADIWAIRILTMEPGTHRSYGPTGGPSGGQRFYSHAMERLRILGEIPVRKFDADGSPVLDPEGHPDTSFLARIPADTPFTFQTIDRDGLVLNMAQTWHQVRPGELRADCGGCHAHSQAPLLFEQTAAGRADYAVTDLVYQTPLVAHDADGQPTLRIEPLPAVTIEFLRDIRPLLQRSCVPCHTKNAADPPGRLVLDDLTPVDGLPGDYARLAEDRDARWGYPSLVRYGDGSLWRQTNASRYVRSFQSRRSLLVWKIFGRRLDGWTNADHPTESVPGDVTTLPAGASPGEADLDFTGTIMPPPGSGVQPLSDDEKMRIARWIDLGAPIDTEQSGYGWFLDEIRPTLTVSVPRPGDNPGPIGEIRAGVADANSGIDAASLSITASFAVGDRVAGTELADLATSAGDGIYVIALPTPLTAAGNAHVVVSVADRQGNVTRVDRRFSVTESGLQVNGSVRASAGGAPVAGVTVDVQGPAPTTATTDTSGAYRVDLADAAVVTIEPHKTGGHAGAISALDASYALQITVGLRTAGAAQRLACDVSGNGSVSALDAVHILRHAVGLANSFPAATACASDWLFIPDPDPAAGQELVGPALTNDTCQRGAIRLPGQTAGGQDFDAVLLGDCTMNWTPPAGSASAAVTATLRPLRERGNTVVYGLEIGANPPLSAVTGEITYEAEEVAAIAVRRGRGAGRALVVSNEAVPGRVRFALASATLVNGGTVATVYVTGHAGARRVSVPAVRVTASP